MRCALPGVRADDARATLTELQSDSPAYESRRQRDPAEHAAPGRSPSRPRAASTANRSRCSPTRRSLPSEFDGQTTVRSFTLVGRDRVRRARACLSWCCSARCSATTRRVRAFESESENKRNQEAILRLLNEMGNLADGDLTVQASVTEDVTGAIADSINFTIEELRTLVRGINSATDQVAKATTGRAGDLEPAVRGLAAAEQGDPAGIGVGAADGAVDQRGVADRRAVGPRRAAVARRRGKRRRRRCRTRYRA